MLVSPNAEVYSGSTSIDARIDARPVSYDGATRRHNDADAVKWRIPYTQYAGPYIVYVCSIGCLYRWAQAISKRLALSYPQTW